MADDTHSVASGGSSKSITNEKIECPHCSKEFQMRVIFNHIRTKHPSDLIDSTTTKWIGEAEQGAALKLVWFKKNDFDEEEDITVYACLSSNKTFTTEQRANLHFKKNPAHKTEHSKQMKKLIKQVEAAKKVPKKSLILLKYLEARKNNCPILARCMWRAIFFHEKGCLSIIENVERLYSPEKIQKYVMRTTYCNFLKGHETLKEWIDILKAKLVEVDAAYKSQSLDVYVLEQYMEWLEKFIIATLPLLEEDVFYQLKCRNQDECIRPRKEDLDEEMYYLASSKWPGVDF